MIYGSESAINLDLLQQRASSSTFGLEKRFHSEKKNWNFHDKTNFFVENINHGIKFAGKKFENFIFSVKKNRKKNCEKIVRNPRKNISKNQKSRLKIARKICWSSLQMG